MVSKGNAEVPRGRNAGVGTFKHVRWVKSVFRTENSAVTHPSKVGENGKTLIRPSRIFAGLGTGMLILLILS